MNGELIRYLEPRVTDAHAAIPNSLDANDSLMIFVSTSLGGDENELKRLFKNDL